MLAFARRMNTHSHLTKVSTTTANNTNNNNHHHLVGSTEEHIPLGIHPEKLLLLHANAGQEPTTPSASLETPKTCSKSTTFYYEFLNTMHTNSTSAGKNYFLFERLFNKLDRQKNVFNYSKICISKQFLLRHSNEVMSCFSLLASSLTMSTIFSEIWLKKKEKSTAFSLSTSTSIRTQWSDKLIVNCWRIQCYQLYLIVTTVGR